MFDKIKASVQDISDKTKIPVPVVYILAAFALIVIIDKLTGG